MESATPLLDHQLSYDWLADISSRLNIIVELIDSEARPFLPAVSSGDARAFREVIAAGEPTIRAAMAEALRTKRSIPVATSGFHALCRGLEGGGLLLVARATADADAGVGSAEDLDEIASWLAGAVAGSLGQPGAVNVEAYRLVSFRRILREATSRGMIREVIGAFVEALSVWDDVRVHCFIAGARGGFLHYASALAALPSSFPGWIDESVVPHSAAMTTLSRAESERLGLTPEPGDTLVLRIAVAGVEWLLVFSGAIDDRERVRLRIYSDMLRECLTEAGAEATNRLVAGVSRHHRATDQLSESAAHDALASLIDAVGGHQGAIAVTLARGRPRLVVGDTALLAAIEDPHRADLLHSSRGSGSVSDRHGDEQASADEASAVDATEHNRVPRLIVRSCVSDSTMTVAIARERPRFNAFERELVQAGAAVLHSWLLPGLQRSATAERRQHGRPIDAIFDELAQQAVSLGRPASVIVLAIDEAGRRLGLLPDWVRRIRGHLRAGDFAGTVSEREIAVLLCGASANQAAAVSARLARMFESSNRAGTAVRPAIGTTTRTPHSPANGSIVAAARASASQR